MTAPMWNGMRVPYITAWTAEHVPRPRIIKVPRPWGWHIGYMNEDPVADRRLEALWVRSGLGQGRGGPDFYRNNAQRPLSPVR
ncbi:hypothetical protein AB0E04_31955 [Streptomyces sp. NPDC048251]|uniref:hypothetical protein n=1 Tax=Streptomyces sp. NPDC048251 TaxID=3154501 RepID=UPI0034136321